MEAQLACNKEKVAIAAAYLANNIQFVCDDLAPGREGSFVQCANSILVMILPSFHRGKKVTSKVTTGSVLAEVALLKLMQLQSQEIINYIRESNPKMADWVGGNFMDFISKAARKYEERQLNSLVGELIS
ncbi:hypothetical protein [Pantoea vagans]|uniref:hypothetical protein n=1 Tax=Pantoea vagans TaxID=470934 RepID=UPI0023B1DC1E|nr:hypothetical protein [Pantoea vagans]MDE8556087.1 hypothetical protein [Pantoea vagans]MDE8576138.1 hypothetical protein [Pantoea vagans]